MNASQFLSAKHRQADSAYIKQWNAVEKALESQLPQSALELVEKIVVQARKDNNHIQSVKALLYKAALTAEGRENSEIEVVQALQLALEQAGGSASATIARSVLQSVLAEFYYEYYQRYRWKYAHRTAVQRSSSADVLASDFRLWDAATLLDTTRRLYMASVTLPSLAVAELQRTPIEHVSTLLVRQAGSETLRPTLYDVLVWRALDFLSNSANDLPKAEREFELDDLTGFKPAQEFIALTFGVPPTPPNVSSEQTSLDSRRLTLGLYQALLAFHRNNRTIEALVDADLHRLRYVRGLTVHEDKEQAYKQALERLAEQYKGQPVSWAILYELASWYAERADAHATANPEHKPSNSSDNQADSHADSTAQGYVRAIALCSEVFRQSALRPDSNRSDKAVSALPRAVQNCLALYDRIRAKQLTITTEKHVQPSVPAMAHIQYRNISAVHFRIYAVPRKNISVDKGIGSEWNPYRGGRLEQPELEALLAQKPLHAWKQELPPQNDYKQHSIIVALPALPVGRYIVLASDRSDFAVSGNGISYTQYTVSRLALLHGAHHRSNGKSNTFITLDAETGQPLGSVKVNCYNSEYDYQKRRYQTMLMASFTTGADGMFDVSSLIAILQQQGKAQQGFFVELVRGEDVYLSEQLFQIQPPAFEPPAFTTTNFFTDRSLYRPGQTIYFKGVMLAHSPVGSSGFPSGLFKAPVQADAEQRTHTVLAKTATTVELLDANSQKVQELRLTTNEFGSFQGAFTAPQTGLLGAMTIRNEYGSVVIHVEEYKRPKFTVMFEPVQGLVRLTETVNVQGKARAFAGSVVDGAAVRYRVVRTARYPYWDWLVWGRPMPSGEEQEIAHGTTTTNERGEFVVNFVLRPDRSISPTLLPTFSYTVYAEVIDLNGETHTAQTSLSAGYTAVELHLDTPEVLDRKVLTSAWLTVCTHNASYQPVASSGTLTVEKLVVPKRLATRALRSRLLPEAQHIALSEEEFVRLFPLDEYRNEQQMKTWETSATLVRVPFVTGADGMMKLPAKQATNADSKALAELDAGCYRITAEMQDASGTMLRVQRYCTIVDTSKRQAVLRSPGALVPLKVRCEPGESATLLFSTAHEEVRVLYQLEQRGVPLKQEWKTLSGQHLFSIPITESHRGGLQVRISFVRDYRFYSFVQSIDVPWTNKELTIETSTFRDKTQPGSAEEWRLVIKPASATTMTTSSISNPSSGERLAANIAAEVVAALYDASLDALLPHTWQTFRWAQFSLFRLPSFLTSTTFGIAPSQMWSQAWFRQRGGAWQSYDELDTRVLERVLGGYGGALYPQIRRKFARLAESSRPQGSSADNERLEMMPSAPPSAADGGQVQAEALSATVTAQAPAQIPAQTQANATNVPAPLDLSLVKARTQLQETAFFFPQLRTDSAGAVILAFTMPESLTQWRFQAFAHTQDVSSGFVERTVVTQKQLMVLPNVPRFLREGDTVTFSVKLSSLADVAMTGAVQLLFFDAYTMKPVDALLKHSVAQKDFRLESSRSAAVSWTLVVPEGSGVESLVYRVIAQAKLDGASAAETVSDGEEAALPILPNAMMVTETLPLWVRGKSSRSFEMKNLGASKQSRTLRHYKLTLEMTSNPLWYALQALPMLMEYPHECAEQSFNRLYANALARHIVHSQPAIRAVVEQWKNSEALLSNLEKRQDLKSALLAETPWVLNGKDETDRKRRVGLLFDLNRMRYELSTALGKLEALQLPNGGFAWFPGMKANRFVTQYIVAGVGHLKKLGVLSSDNLSSEQSRVVADMSVRLHSIAQKALRFCDEEMHDEYQSLKKLPAWKPSEMYLNQLAVQYLYARSYFAGEEIPVQYNEAYQFWLDQAKTFWAKQSLMAQAMIVLALEALDQRGSTREIMLKSFRERALRSEEMGMYWKELERSSWWWYEAPVETQALMIEVFETVARDPAAVEELQIWLLKQKQTQDWRTTKATAEACYALLLRGNALHASDTLVEATVGKVSVKAQRGDKPRSQFGGNAITNEQPSPEVGTGYYRYSWSAGDITPEMGTVSLIKRDDGIAWGGLYWQYFEKLNAIKPAQTPLALVKTLYRQRNTEKGLVIEPITAQMPLRVGDLVKVRIELRSDRDMEYIHLKDMRGAGLEPVSTLSQYRWQGGLGYYESMKDASANFFIGWLPKGVYVFEYALRATHAGAFSNGITTIQSMYAPEFSAHSEGAVVRIR